MSSEQKTVVVTGGNGFIGLHIINKLLKSGFKVKATVRDKNNEKKTADLKKLENQQNLEIVSASLTDKSSFEGVFDNADILVHSASPIGLGGGSEQEFVKPSLEGVKNVFDTILEQKNPTLKQVIFFSSIYAQVSLLNLDYQGKTFKEDDWADTGLQKEEEQFYPLSKTLAEKEVLNYEKKLKDKNIVLSRILPALVLGPTLFQSDEDNNKINASNSLILDLLSGKAEKIPNMAPPIIDVRDIADLIYQMIVQKVEGRVIALEGGYHMEKVADLCRKYGQQYSKNVPKEVDNQPKIPEIKWEKEKTNKILSKPFISLDKTIEDTIQDMINKKLIESQ